MKTVNLALVGDRRDSVPAHICIPIALKLAGEFLNVEVKLHWIPSGAVNSADITLTGFSGIWLIPGSPYASMQGALGAVRFARENAIPFLGTCGGFQHAIIEFARHVAGLPESDHAESNPRANIPVISLLPCSLVDQRGAVTLADGSKLRAAYGTVSAYEKYHCSYGVNTAYLPRLEAAGLRFTAIDDTGDVRAAELATHPFFIGTLFQPERSAENRTRHPLITAFVAAMANRTA